MGAESVDDQFMPFQPGKSGNPSGRPKMILPDGRSLADLAKEHTQTAVKALVDVIRSPRASPAAKVQAATALLDRGWGRPHVAVSLDTERCISAADELEAARLREQQLLDDPYYRNRMFGK